MYRPKWLDDLGARIRASMEESNRARLQRESEERKEQEKIEAAEEAKEQAAIVAETARVRDEIEVVIKTGKRLVRLERTNTHWQGAVVAYAESNERVLFVQFHTYYMPYQGVGWMHPQRALLTLATSKA